MLSRVVTAVKTDKTKALSEFTKGEAGFRTVDSYVFCVGPTGIMTAHPSPMLQGQDVRELHDNTGNYFIATMLKTAQPGTVSEIHYLFPRPGSNTAAPKTTYYTKADDQVCGVGVYDGDEAAPASVSPQVRFAALRQRLSSEIPEGLRDDWNRFLQALDEKTSVQSSALTKARDQLRAAEATLSTGTGADQ